MDEQGVLKLLGKPTERTPQPSWVYWSTKTKNQIEVHFERGRVIQIDFTSPIYQTRDGLTVQTVGNRPNQSDIRAWRIPWRFVNLKFSLRIGGLTFYCLNADSADPEYPVRYIGVVHKGTNPKREALSTVGEPNNGWHPWDGKDIYSDGAKAAAKPAGKYAVAGIDNDAAVEAFLRTLKTAVATNSRARTATLFHYPLRVNYSGRTRYIGDAQEFVRSYEALLTKPIRQALAEQRPEALFVNYQGVMIGDGVLWFGADAKTGALKVITINHVSGKD